MNRTRTGLPRLYRVCTNPHSNDWNDEPEYISVPYDVIRETPKAYEVVRAGWGTGKKQRHFIPKDQFYSTKEECDKACLKKAHVYQTI